MTDHDTQLGFDSLLANAASDNRLSAGHDRPVAKVGTHDVESANLLKNNKSR